MMATALLACLILGADGPAHSKRPAAKPLPAYKVLFVVDSDTVVLQIDGRATRIKLLGVERSGAVGEAGAQLLGTRALRELLDGHSVRVRHEPGPDRMHVVGPVAQVQLRRATDDLWVNREMIASGYATSGRYAFDDSKEFLAAEVEARAARRGLWSPEVATAAAAEGERSLTTKRARVEAAVAQRQDERQRRADWRAEMRRTLDAQRAAEERDDAERKKKEGKGYCKACGKNDWGDCMEK